MENYEIDRLLAEKIMGLQEDEEMHFHPTTNIEHAFKIVEKLREERILFSVNNTIGTGYMVTFFDLIADKQYRTDYIANAPLAISKSALKVANDKW